MPDDHRTRTNEPVAGRGSEGQDAKRDGTGDAVSADVGVEPGGQVRVTETTPIGTVRLTSLEADDEATLPVTVASQVLVGVVDDTA